MHVGFLLLLLLLLKFLAPMTHFLISDVLECVADDVDAHVDQIRGCNFKHSLGELLAIFVDFLHRKILDFR